MVIYSNHLLRSTYFAMEKIAKSILKNGRSYGCEKYCMPIDQILNDIKYIKKIIFFLQSTLEVINQKILNFSSFLEKKVGKVHRNNLFLPTIFTLENKNILQIF